MATPAPTLPALSLVVPAHDEQDNVALLVDEVERTLVDGGLDLELIVVDDGSSDLTAARLEKLATDRRWLRVVTLPRRRGLSNALRTGFREARAPLVGTLDADLQNDPRDLVTMLERMREADPPVALVVGDRIGRRSDGLARVTASAVGRAARRLLLGDGVRDAGCGIRLLRTDVAVLLPLEYDGMHRFIPLGTRLLGGRVLELPVSHRPRRSGRSKFGVGAWQRGARGLVDCLAVRWMRSRYRGPLVGPDGSVAESPPRRR